MYAQNTKQVIQALGVEDMARALGVGNKAIYRSGAVNEFPPSWYFVVQGLAKKKNYSIDVGLFGFKS